jgi:hypothetical protein
MCHGVCCAETTLLLCVPEWVREGRDDACPPRFSWKHCRPYSPLISYLKSQEWSMPSGHFVARS